MPSAIEVLSAGESLRRPARDTFGTLVHEAPHASPDSTWILSPRTTNSLPIIRIGAP